MESTLDSVVFVVVSVMQGDLSNSSEFQIPCPATSFVRYSNIWPSNFSSSCPMIYSSNLQQLGSLIEISRGRGESTRNHVAFQR